MNVNFTKEITVTKTVVDFDKLDKYLSTLNIGKKELSKNIGCSYAACMKWFKEKEMPEKYVSSVEKYIEEKGNAVQELFNA